MNAFSSTRIKMQSGCFERLHRIHYQFFILHTSTEFNTKSTRKAFVDAREREGENAINFPSFLQNNSVNGSQPYISLSSWFSSLSHLERYFNITRSVCFHLLLSCHVEIPRSLLRARERARVKIERTDRKFSFVMRWIFAELSSIFQSFVDKIFQLVSSVRPLMFAWVPWSPSVLFFSLNFHIAKNKEEEKKLKLNKIKSEVILRDKKIYILK